MTTIHTRQIQLTKMLVMKTKSDVFCDSVLDKTALSWKGVVSVTVT